MRNYALDTKMLPKVWITWATTKNRQFDQRYWLNCQTGKKKNKPEPWMYYKDEKSIDSWPWLSENINPCGINYKSRHQDNVWVKSGSAVRYAYVKYHADIERLELAAVGIDTTRKVEPHPWHFLGDRFFLGKDKSIIDINGNPIHGRFMLYEYHTAWDERELLRMLLRIVPIRGFVGEFKKFIGADTFTIGNGAVEHINSVWHLQRWFETVQKKRSKGKQQKLVDTLTSVELSDASGFADRFPALTNEYSGLRGIIPGFVYYEKVNDEWDVLRKFSRRRGEELEEYQRIYIGSDGTVRVASLVGGTWIPAKYTSSSSWRYERCYLANKEDAIAGCNRIKYVLDAAGDVSVSLMVDFLVASLRFPEIEQMAKFGYIDKMLDIVGSDHIKADLKNMFGGHYNDKEKNILRKVGMTKHQFDTFMSERNGLARKAMSQMRTLFGGGVQHLDNASFDRYFAGCVKMCAAFWHPVSERAETLHFDALRFFKNLTRLSEKRDDVFRIANDTMNSYLGLNYGTAPDVDWYFDDVSDLVRTHDAIVELNRAQMVERRARWSVEDAERQKQDEERRVKLDEKRKELEYEDDNYIIRLPKTLAEITSEGSAQHICIGGYTRRHANGETNLFFLRKKEDEDKPFYAIEMNNGKQIVQIHGFGNKWLGNDPDAIPTVVRWLRKNGISCDEKILTCKAVGYGRVNDYVPMPVVD